jgi:hypothetical protein
MIDYFALAVTHAVLAMLMLRLLKRSDLDRDMPAAPPEAPEVAPVAEPAVGRAGVVRLNNLGGGRA